MITEAYGKELEVQLQRNLTVLVQLQAQRPQARGSLVLVSISFMVLMIISSAWLVFYFIQKLRHSGARHRSQVSTTAKTTPLLTASPMTLATSTATAARLAPPLTASTTANTTANS